jgi:putative chitinase
MDFFTIEQLRAVMPAAKPAAIRNHFPHLIVALVEFKIDTPERIAAFLAQCAHESGSLKYMSEIWGPTAQQRKYDPPWKVAKDLGNVIIGDGKRFRGRGVIQITGRANYQKYGERLGLNLIKTPELAALPTNAWRIAGAYWDRWDLNALADLGTDEGFVLITRRINGGINGLADRREHWKQAKAALGILA